MSGAILRHATALITYYYQLSHDLAQHVVTDEMKTQLLCTHGHTMQLSVYVGILLSNICRIRATEHALYALKYSLIH